MRHVFFYFLVGSLLVALAAWAFYMLGRAFNDLWLDWKLGRELDELQSESASRRQQRHTAGEQRLASGCEHDFNAGAIGLPPNVCAKCGLEKVKPTGLCDHVWRVKPGPVPSSECEHCGKIYHPLQPAPDLPRR